MALKFELVININDKTIIDISALIQLGKEAVAQNKQKIKKKLDTLLEKITDENIHGEV